jgi:hypothetical protein
VLKRENVYAVRGAEHRAFGVDDDPSPHAGKAGQRPLALAPGFCEGVPGPGLDSRHRKPLDKEEIDFSSAGRRRFISTTSPPERRVGRQRRKSRAVQSANACLGRALPLDG